MTLHNDLQVQDDFSACALKGVDCRLIGIVYTEWIALFSDFMRNFVEQLESTSGQIT